MSLHEWSAAMYTNDTKEEIITRIDVATRLIREITTAFATNDDCSAEALKNYNAAMEEHIAALADVQQVMDKIITDMDTPPST
jgi:bacterioferritin (cytochrome b1)